MQDKPTSQDKAATLKRAYLHLEALQAKLREAQNAFREPIAIIGMGCRFPGHANEAESFWNVLKDGVDAVTPVPPERWDVDDFYDPDPDAPGKMVTRLGAFLKDIDKFDAGLFGISPREATSMDPKQRILLEVVWEALEDASQAPDMMAGSRTGVFVGIIGAEYQQLQTAGTGILHIDPYFGSGVSNSIASGRISYLLGLQGPSVSVDTSCSSSLVAIHLACQSLRNRESKLAVAGGVNLMLIPDATIILTKHRLMAPDGRCKTFDQSADGYGRGEGCGIVVLKRLSDALADGDRILALIKGTAANQDGPSSGLTAPHGPAQQAVIQMALDNAGVEPADIGYVETHGTGTALGDPIEVQALSAVLREGRPSDRPIYIGAVKTNVGHLEAAAGVASLIKVVLMLQKREIPPHLHMKVPNPHIPWDRLPVIVAREPTPWPESYPLVAGVSSFGFSGTNVHMIIQAYENDRHQPPGIERPRHVLGLSAINAGALKALAHRFRRYLDRHSDQSLADICFSANAGRAKHAHRLAIAADSLTEMRDHLDNFIAERVSAATRTGVCRSEEPPKVTFLFPGLGAQYIDMGRLLYDSQPVFKETVDACSAVLRSNHGFDLMPLLYPNATARREAETLINQAGNALPALFALECALLALWRSWGIEPTAVMGHGAGEMVAAYAAGIVDLEDGLKLAFERAQLMQSCAEGTKTVAVFADEGVVVESLDKIDGLVALDATNGPQHMVVSGQEQRVDQLLRLFDSRRVRYEELAYSNAFQSPGEDHILEGFDSVAASIKTSEPRIHLISNLTGKSLSRKELADPTYWRRQLRSPILFHRSIETLYKMGFRVFVEIGPRPVLCNLAAACLPDKAVAYLPSLRRAGNDWQEVLDSLATLFAKGVRVDWVGFDQPYKRRRLSLPSYPFQRRRFWPQGVSAPKPLPQSFERDHPLLGSSFYSAPGDVQFERSLRDVDFDFVNDHRVNGFTLLPATAFIEMVFAGARSAYGAGTVALEDFIIHQPLFIEPDKTLVVQTIVSPASENDYHIKIFSREKSNQASSLKTPTGEGMWTVHATGRISMPASEAENPPTATPLLSTVLENCTEEIPGSNHYAELAQRGFTFGPALQGVSFLKRGHGEVVGRIRLPESSGNPLGRFHFHPALMDSCLQFFWAILPDGSPEDSYLPMSFEGLRLYTAPETDLWSHIAILPTQPGNSGAIEGSVRIYTTNGKLVLELNRLVFRKADKDISPSGRPTGFSDWFYQVDWEPAKDVASGKSEIRNGITPALTWMPDPEQIASHVKRSTPPLEQHEALASHHRFIARIESLSSAYVAAALKDIGFQYQAGQFFTEEEAFKHLGIVGRYRRLFHRLLEILSETGFLRPEGDRWEVVRPLHGAELPSEQLHALSGMPGAAASAHLELVSRCGKRFAEALTGRADPLALLFPDGSLSLASRLYSESPEARVYNSLIKEAVCRALEDLPAGRKIRILELGAGTGGATSFVLPGLDPKRTDYVFSDISTLFLERAAERFGDYPFVTYTLCNIERNVKEQGFQENSYDIVIAMNMIHATSDLRRSLRNVHTLLVPGGVLILLEGTAPERWIDVTFGLTDGWWAFTDTDLRPHYPLLSREKWCQTMEGEGFENAVTAPEPTSLSPEALIIARKPTQDAAADQSDLTANGKWLILSDSDGIGAELAGHLESTGAECVLAIGARTFSSITRNRWQLRFDHSEDFSRLFKEIAREGGPALGQIVHLAGINATHQDVDLEMGMAESQIHVTQSLLFMTKALLANPDRGRAPKLTIVTKGSQATDQAQTVEFTQGPAWGIGKVIALEHPELGCRCIDLDPRAAAGESADSLFRELINADQEELVAIRSGQRVLPRLKRAAVPAGMPLADGKARSPQPMRLEKTHDGLLDALQLKPLDLPEPAYGEVQINVHAAGLSFRDVMNALSMRDDPEPLGSECSGTIAKVGAGVNALACGDEVIALGTGCMGTVVNVASDFVVPKPANLSFEEASTIPTAFVTAYHALIHLGKLSRGERILIHAAAGGVGMAAVQIALSTGARVIGTAGSEEKRRYLQSMGVDNAMDSRTLSFAEEIMTITDGNGVDLVLNSLSGEFITKSLSVVAPNGRFVEIGKQDIMRPDQVHGMRQDVIYHIVDLAADSQNRPERLRDLLQQVTAYFDKGEYRPLPSTIFSLEQATAAFRFMSQSRHTGKIVLRRGQSEGVHPQILNDATYLVTGGLSGLGWLVVQWLVQQGAKHIAVMARSPVDKVTREVFTQWAQEGVSVHTFQVDVSDRQHLAKCVDELRGLMPALKGIIHCAGVLADAVLLNQTWGQFEAVYKPKMYGAWNLHCLTASSELDFFILFSSTAGLLGSMGQSNHAAANAFLDALAHYRRHCGMAALSINWGVWTGVGAAAQRKADERIGSQGIGVIIPEKGIKAMERVMRGNGAQIAVVPIDWPAFFKRYTSDRIPAWLSKMRNEAKPSGLRRLAKSQTVPAVSSNVLEKLFRLPAGRRQAALMDDVMEKTAKVLGLSATTELDIEKPLNEQGVDSLIAVELRNLLGTGLGLQKGLPATLVFDYPTIKSLTEFLYQQTPLFEEDKAEAQLEADGGSEDIIGAIEDLSDEEVERLLGEGEESR